MRQRPYRRILARKVPPAAGFDNIRYNICRISPVIFEIQKRTHKITDSGTFSSQDLQPQQICCMSNMEWRRFQRLAQGLGRCG
jgi:hypothetical protein